MGLYEGAISTEYSELLEYSRPNAAAVASQSGQVPPALRSDFKDIDLWTGEAEDYDFAESENGESPGKSSPSSSSDICVFKTPNSCEELAS